MDQLQAELKDTKLPSHGVWPLASDGFGNLYASTPEGYLWKSGIQNRISETGRKASIQPRKRQDRSRAELVEIRPRPALDFPISLLSISPDGSHAVVAGVKQEDELIGVAILDLTDSQLGRKSSNYIYTQAQLVDEELFSNRPGLEVVQISWHPESLRHLVILTSDNVLRLYCLDDLTIAEQSFSLQLTPDRGLGLLDYDTEAIVAFAFARGEGWEKYTIYLVSSSGKIFMLCPVAPFGSSYQRFAAQEMLDAVTGDDAESFASCAWVQQALPACLDGQASAQNLATPPRQPSQQTFRVQPHALSEHTVSLQGPLPVSSPDPEISCALDLRPGNDRASCLSHSWYNEQCSLLVLASAGGVVAWHLIAHTPRPEWTERDPNCVLSEDGKVVAVKNQVEVSESWNGELLLLAAADVRLDGSNGNEFPEPGGRPMLLPDPVSLDAWYLVHPCNSFLLTAPWTLRLASQLGSGKDVDIQAELTQTQVEELWAETTNSRQCLGSCIVGTQLTGTDLLLLLSDGNLKRLQAADVVPQDEDKGISDSSREQISNQIKAIYGDIWCGPRRLELPPASHVGVQQPEGQKLLGTSIKILREKYVEFIHQAHNELDMRIDFTEEGLKLQAERVKLIEKALAAIEQKHSTLTQRLHGCELWNQNLLERMDLLTELHWSRDHPLSDAELDFKSKELPELEKHVKTLGTKIKGLAKQSKVLGNEATHKGPAVSSLPISQMRNLRTALSQQSEIISNAQNLLALLYRAYDKQSSGF